MLRAEIVADGKPRGGRAYMNLISPRARPVIERLPSVHDAGESPSAEEGAVAVALVIDEPHWKNSSELRANALVIF